MSAARRGDRGDQVDHRGIVLAGVLVVVVILALISATALVAADAEMSAAQGSLRREQARALAWSGVRAVMAELGRQRAEIMDGTTPEVTNSWALFGEAAGSGGPGGVIQLLEIEPGRYVAPEAGKLDLNTVSAEVLAASGAVDEAAARSIVSARGSGMFGSVEEAIAGSGATGSDSESGEFSGREAELTSIAAGAGASEGSATGAEERAMRLLTVFAFEPNVQVGLGDSGSDFAGKPRIYIGDGWRDELKAPLEERLGEKLGGDVAAALREGAVQSMGPVINRLQKRGVVVKDWAEVLDAVTMSPDRYVAGRVDVLTAPVEVLRGLPGVEGQAEQIVRTRDRIDAEARRSVVWLVQQGVLTEAQFEAVVDQVTCRSMQWRVRVQAGFNAPVGASGERSASAEPVALRDRVVLEAVVDVSGSKPRLAYLRDITMMEIQPAVAELVGPAGEGVTPEAAVVEPEPASTSEGAGLDVDAGLDLKTRAKPKGLNMKRMDLGGGMKSSRPDLSSDLKMDTDLDVGSAGGDSSSKAATADSEGDGGASAGLAPAAGAKELTPGVDRRFGRWKIPSGAGGRSGGVTR